MNYEIKSRIWIQSSQGVFLGEGRIQLLKAVQQHGSLSKASKSLKMSYKKAWNLMDAINKTGKEPLVLTNTGGTGGGGSSLTPYGKRMIATFEKINKSCWEFLDQQLKDHQLTE